MSRPLPSPTPPTDPTLSASCLDFLLIELVPLAQRITDHLHARDQALREEYKRSQIFHDRPAVAASAAAGTGAGKEGGEKASNVTDVASVGGAPTDNTTNTAAGGVDDETRDAVFWRLDGLGYRVGQGLVERYGLSFSLQTPKGKTKQPHPKPNKSNKPPFLTASRFSANRPRPTTPLDSIKFICKDLWPLLFRKQIDNLKTNHRGVFVLTDARFGPISRVSVDRKAGVKAPEETLSRAQAVSFLSFSSLAGNTEFLENCTFRVGLVCDFVLTVAAQYLYFPCGIIRGALAGLGMDVTVHADSSEIPAATFQIKTRGAKA